MTFVKVVHRIKQSITKRSEMLISQYINSIYCFHLKCDFCHIISVFFCQLRFYFYILLTFTLFGFYFLLLILFLSSVSMQSFLYLFLLIFRRIFKFSSNSKNYHNRKSYEITHKKNKIKRSNTEPFMPFVLELDI